jgi:hypothetical protein
MRRTFLAVLILAACRHGAFYEQSRVPRQCGQPRVVCIDPATLAPSPDPIHLGYGTWGQFFFVSGSDELKIEADVLENKDHQGGHAWGYVRKDAKPGRYKYSIINVTTGRRNDPTIIIDP